MNKVFVCYSRKDLAFVAQLVESLKAKGIDPWLDLEDLPPIRKWKPQALQAVYLSHNFVYVLSPDSVASEHCSMELECANRHNKRLIPVFIRHIENFEAIHPSIRELNWLFFNRFPAPLEELVKILEAPEGELEGLTDRSTAFLDVWNLSEQEVISYPLIRSAYWVGRAPWIQQNSNHGSIPVIDKSFFVSRLHCQIFYEKDAWRLKVFGKNGAKIVPELQDNCLVDGTEIFLGDVCRLAFRDRRQRKEEPGDNQDTLV